MRRNSFSRTDRAVWVFVFESSRPSAVARGATRWLPSRQLCLEGATKWLLLIFISVHNLFQLRCCMQLSAKILHYAVSGSFTQRYFCGTRTVCRTDSWPNGQLAERTIGRTDSLPNGQLGERTVGRTFVKNVFVTQ